MTSFIIKYSLNGEVYRDKTLPETALNYSYLIMRAKDLFPFLSSPEGSKFNFAWTDEEGELIQLTSDKQILDAIKTMKSQNKIMRFEIIVKSLNSNQMVNSFGTSTLSQTQVVDLSAASIAALVSAILGSEYIDVSKFLSTFNTDEISFPTVSLDLIDLDTSIELSMGRSGLVTNGTLVYHIREECKTLWQFLSQKVLVTKLVQGPPGVGKSVECYTFAIDYAMKMNKKLLYIHSNDDSYHIVIKKNNESGSMQWKHIRNENIRIDFLVKWITYIVENERNGMDMVVVDGLFPEHFFISMCNIKIYNPEISLFICTSFQALTINQRFAGKMDFEWYTMCSWTFAEYESAVKSKAILVATIDLLKEKYFYSGGSIRLMNFNIDITKLILDCHLSKVSNMSFLLSGNVGNSSESATNSLIAVFRNGPKMVSTVLSEYVGKSLSDSCSKEIIEKCRNIMINNPSWQGWVTEFEVLAKILRSKEFKVWDENDSSEVWTRGEGITTEEFWDIEEVLQRPFIAGLYLIPRKYNQGFFDLLYFITPKKLRIIQITSAKSHSFNFHLVTPLLNTLNVKEVEYVIICRRSNFYDLQIPENPRIAARKVCYEAPVGSTPGASFQSDFRSSNSIQAERSHVMTATSSLDTRKSPRIASSISSLAISDHKGLQSVAVPDIIRFLSSPSSNTDLYVRSGGIFPFTWIFDFDIQSPICSTESNSNITVIVLCSPVYQFASVCLILFPETSLRLNTNKQKKI
eukprot:gene8270-17018_t